MISEDTWGHSTLHSCLSTSKCEIQCADHFLIDKKGFICLACGWALAAKNRQGSNDRGLGRALEQLVALETQRLEEKGWRQWWRTSGKAVRIKQMGTMKLVLGNESDHCHRPWLPARSLMYTVYTDSVDTVMLPHAHLVPSLPSPQQLSKPISPSSHAQMSSFHP